MSESVEKHGSIEVVTTTTKRLHASHLPVNSKTRFAESVTIMLADDGGCALRLRQPRGTTMQDNAMEEQVVALTATQRRLVRELLNHAVGVGL